MIRLLLYILLFCSITTIFKFSTHSGISSHNQSTEVKNVIKATMDCINVRVDRNLYFIYQPFMINGEKVNGEVFVRKTAHVTEYFILGLICSLLIALSHKKQFALKRYVLLFLGPIIAFIDEEIVQKFLVIHRTSSIKDIILDCIGFFLAIAIIQLTLWLYHKKQKSSFIKSG